MVGRTMRAVGKGLDSLGASIQGANAYRDRLMPSARVVAVKGKELSHGLEGFVASTASVVGDVELGEKASVWYGSVVRGEGAKVVIGRGSAVQDRAQVSGETKIGNDVSVGPGATLSACTLADGVLVGPGASVLDGAFVGADSYIDGGAVVGAGVKVPAGELWTGNPAAKLRKLSEEEMSYLRASAQRTAEMAEEHYQQSIVTADGREAQEAEYEFRKGEFMKWDAPLPEENEDLAEYNRLSYNPHDVGMFRATDYDEAAEWEAFQEADDEDDARVDAEADSYARMDRVNDAAQQIMSQHWQRHPIIIAGLRDRDPEAADILESMLARVDEACESKDAARDLESFLTAGGAKGFAVAFEDEVAAAEEAKA